MDVITLRLAPGERPASARSQRCRVAGFHLEVEPALVALTPFEVSEPPAERPFVGESSPPPADGASGTLFEGDGWLGERDRSVCCRRAGGDYLLEVEGAGVFRIASDGTVLCLRRDPHLTEQLLTEIAVGPALILSLALHGTFCLHAAAIARSDGAVAFLGVSGSGKSTLAAKLGGETATGTADRWRRLADDVLPIPQGVEPPSVCPQFPQLKLRADSQAVRPRDRQVPLVAAVLLEPVAADQEPALESLPRLAGTCALVRHTVASRLFAPELLARHLSFCADLAERVPVVRLRYPHRPGAIAETGLLLEGFLPH